MEEENERVRAEEGKASSAVRLERQAERKAMQAARLVEEAETLAREGAGTLTLILSLTLT